MASLWTIRTLVDRVFGVGEVKVEIAASTTGYKAASTQYSDYVRYIILTAYSAKAGKRIERLLPDSVNKSSLEQDIREVLDFSPFIYNVSNNYRCYPKSHFNKFLFRSSYLVSILDKDGEVEG